MKNIFHSKCDKCGERGITFFPQMLDHSIGSGGMPIWECMFCKTTFC